MKEHYPNLQLRHREVLGIVCELRAEASSMLFVSKMRYSVSAEGSRAEYSVRSPSLVRDDELDAEAGREEFT